MGSVLWSVLMVSLSVRLCFVVVCLMLFVCFCFLSVFARCLCGFVVVVVCLFVCLFVLCCCCFGGSSACE